MTELPPFPVDDATLDMLSAALDPRAYGDEHAERTCVGEFLTMMSQLGGGDERAEYHVNEVLSALVAEIRRLRRGVR